MPTQKRITLENTCTALNIKPEQFLEGLAEGTIKLSSEVFWNGSFHTVRRKQVEEALRSSRAINIDPSMPSDLHEFLNPVIDIMELKFRATQVVRLCEEIGCRIPSSNSEAKLRSADLNDDACLQKEKRFTTCNDDGDVVVNSAPKSSEAHNAKNKPPATEINMAIVLKAARDEMPGLNIKTASAKWLNCGYWNLTEVSKYLHEVLTSSNPLFELTQRTVYNILTYHKAKLPLPTSLPGRVSK